MGMLSAQPRQRQKPPATTKATVLTEGPRKTTKPRNGTKRRMSPVNVRASKALGETDRALIVRLFEGPMTAERAAELVAENLGIDNTRMGMLRMFDCRMRINAWAKKEYGRKGIVWQGKRGGSQRRLALNPAVFAVPDTDRTEVLRGLRSLEGEMPEGGAIRRKIKAGGVSRLQGLTPGKKTLIAELFESPMTREEALVAYTAYSIHTHLERINKWARERYGQNAIIRTSLRGKGKPSGSWIMFLNSNIFDVDYSDYDPRDHAEIEGVLSEGPRKIFLKLAELGWATKEELEAAGVLEWHIDQYIIHRCKTTDKQCREKGFPPAIIATRSQPKIYIPNPEFAAMMVLAVNERIELDKMFGKTDLALIHYLAKHGQTTPTVLSKALKVSPQTIVTARHRINERCRELELVEAIETRESGRPRFYGLSEDFAEEVELERTDSTNLKSFFPARQIDAIKFLAINPFSTIEQVAQHLGITRKLAERHLCAIKKTCENEGLPPVLTVGKPGMRYGLSDEFAARFGLKKKRMYPISIVPDDGIRREVYSFFRRRKRTIPQAMAEFGLTYGRAYAVVSSINDRYLIPAGFDPVEPKLVKGNGISRLARAA